MGFQNFVLSNKGAVESAETAACTQFLFAETAAYLHGGRVEITSSYLQMIRH